MWVYFWAIYSVPLINIKPFSFEPESNQQPKDGYRQASTVLRSTSWATEGNTHMTENIMNIQWRKDSLSKSCWENLTAVFKSMKLQHSLTPYPKIHSKWLKDLNIRHGTIKLLEENTGKHFLNSNSVFLGQPPKAIKIKLKINNGT